MMFTYMFSLVEFDPDHPAWRTVMVMDQRAKDDIEAAEAEEAAQTASK